MNECEYAIRLGAYHDGELSSEQRTDVERHVQQCPSCTAELENLAALSRKAQAMPRAELSAAMLQRLHKRVDSLPSRTINRFAEAMAAVAAMVLVTCSVGLLTRPATGQAPQTVESLDQIVSTQPAENSSAGGEEQLASWMVEDLSGRNQHD